jgi:hypothetical protein
VLRSHPIISWSQCTKIYPEAASAANDHHRDAAGAPSGCVIIGDARMSYCWTHGCTTNCAHNSSNCTNKCDGHDLDLIIQLTITNRHQAKYCTDKVLLQRKGLLTAVPMRLAGRLVQGRAGTDIKGTETIHFLRHTAIPAGQKATYFRIVVDIRPQKAEPHRVRFTVGGNLIKYLGNVSTPTADMTTAKLVVNSTLSTPGAKYSCFNISNFYLNTPMKRYEYMQIPIWAIPDCIMEQYNLAQLVHDGHVLCDIRKGMYSLPQAGLIAYKR